MAWLIVFGLLHAHLLWYGDILYWYGMCGLLVYLFRKCSPKWLIFWGLLFIAVASGISLAAGLSVEYWSPEALDQIVNDLKPSPEVIADEIMAYRSHWLQQMDTRVAKALEMGNI